MARYLQQHPAVFMSRIKEPSYFLFDGDPPAMGGPFDAVRQREMITSWDKYQSLFTPGAHETAVGEASVRYLYSAQACHAIHRRLPEVKLILGLRNPVERAFSHYRMLHGSGVEPCASFEAALADGPRREREFWFIGRHRALGFYTEHVQRYIDTFGRDRLHIYLYDDLVADPHKTLRDLFGFLGVDPAFEPDFSVRHNMGADLRNPLLRGLWRHSRGLRSRLMPLVPTRLRGHLIGFVASRQSRIDARPKLSPETRRALTDGYREEIAALARLIDRDLSAWLTIEDPPAGER